ILICPPPPSTLTSCPSLLFCAALTTQILKSNPGRRDCSSNITVGPVALNLFKQLPQILKDDFFFVRARTISEKKFLAQFHGSSFHTIGIEPLLYRTQKLISVYLTFPR